MHSCSSKPRDSYSSGSAIGARPSYQVHLILRVLHTLSSLTEGATSMFHNIHHLQVYASSLVRDAQKDSDIQWHHGSNYSSVNYHGNEVKLEDIWECLGTMEDETVSLLEDQPMSGHHFPLDIPSLKDDLGQKDPGYSLFSEERNLSSGDEDALLTYIINTPSLRQEFKRRIDSNHIQWNLPRLHTWLTDTWLTDFAQLDTLCLLQVLMSGSAPARATELTGMLRQNSSQGMERSLRILGRQSVVLIVLFADRDMEFF
ncbi:hypothetical protein GY45DRAFT_1263921 [Cubamyces sp. BRFM 1775]|nr:hypothetical protein GY45DRAFT_1263921 [Cubamyces sp. BRFM 1775]